MKLALAQLDAVVGDLAGNAAKILDHARRAHAAGAGVLLTPELSLTGYSPEDLLLRPGFCRASAAALGELATRLPPEIAVVVGHPEVEGERRYNAASVLTGGRIAHTYRKFSIPNYAVFDEARYFSPGHAPCVFEVRGVRFGLNVCDDVWHAEAPRAAAAAGAQVLLVPNASPFHLGKQGERREIMAARVRETGLAVVYCNRVGGQDELVFDGASFVLGADGGLRAQRPAFAEELAYLELDGADPLPGEVVPDLSLEASAYRAILTGLRDYVRKSGFESVELGLSGGVDSALTLALAVDALGAARVHALMMPSPYTAAISLEDARALAANLGVAYEEIAIAPAVEALERALEPGFRGLAADLTEENLQARVRGTLLMARSNKFNRLILTTGNKSEMAVGYATLYGDMAGGFAVLKDVDKTLVYRLARHRNAVSAVIPERVLSRAPSAELRPDQTDQDSLPAYEILDAVMALYVEQDLCPDAIVARGFDPADVRRVVTLIDRNEYKRSQATIGPRITPRGFGKESRVTICSGYLTKL